MKKSSILLFFMLAYCFAFGQKKQYIYCELVGTEKFLSNKVVINIDFGQNQKFLSFNNTIKDENGKTKAFNSMVDALNYMGSLGWEFVQAYTVTEGNQSVYHWLLKKEAEEGDLDYLKNSTGKNKKN